MSGGWAGLAPAPPSRPDPGAVASSFSKVYPEEDPNIILGFVTERNTARGWIQFFAPVYKRFYYSRNRHLMSFPVSAMVSMQPWGTINVDRQERYAVNGAKLLDEKALSGYNSDGHDQAWGTGTSRGSDRGDGGTKWSISIRMTPAHAIISYNPLNLAPGSRVLPKGSPLVFQTSTPQQRKGGSRVQVHAVQYDAAKFGLHMGPTPSTPLLQAYESNKGRFCAHIGGTRSTDCRSISILDLVDHLDRPDSASFLDILHVTQKVLSLRLRLCEEDDEEKKSLQDAVTQFELGIVPRVLVSPTLFPAKHWQFLINNFFHQRLQNDLTVSEVVVIEGVSTDITIANVDFKLGLLNRHADCWRTGQYLHSLHLQQQADAFVLIDQSGQTGLGTWEHKAAFELDVTHRPTLDPLQALLTTYRPVSNDLGQLVRSCTTTEDGDDFQANVPPSLHVTFKRDRSSQALDVLDGVFAAETSDRVEITHPHGWYRHFRIMPVGATLETVDSLVSQLNGLAKSTGGLLHAGPWEQHEQEHDDEQVRTLVCRAGYQPDLSLLQDVDPEVLVKSWVHGCLRLVSRLPTTQWITQLRALNEAGKKKVKFFFKPSFHLFQAIRDGTGLHWICEEATASAPRMRSWSAPPSSLSPPSTKNYQVICGPTIFWPEAAIREALAKLNIVDPGGDLHWAQIAGEKAPKLITTQTGTGPVLLKGFISLTITPLSVSSFNIIRPALGRTGTFDMARASQVLASCPKNGPDKTSKTDQGAKDLLDSLHNRNAGPSASDPVDKESGDKEPNATPATDAEGFTVVVNKKGNRRNKDDKSNKDEAKKDYQSKVRKDQRTSFRQDGTRPAAAERSRSFTPTPSRGRTRQRRVSRSPAHDTRSKSPSSAATSMDQDVDARGHKRDRSPPDSPLKPSAEKRVAVVGASSASSTPVPVPAPVTAPAGPGGSAVSQ